MSCGNKQQDGRVAIVTGASGGIGEATARALAGAGYRVFGTHRKSPQSKATGVEYLVCDVTSAGSVEAAVKEVLAKTGRTCRHRSVGRAREHQGHAASGSHHRIKSLHASQWLACSLSSQANARTASFNPLATP
jgi:NAD(P)-dependent dehydrogenase (short-subunit alcohol dehydrogenase family)